MDSINNEPIYNTTNHLSLLLYDYANTYFLPLICLFGIITSSISIIVIIKNKLNNDFNKFLFINSCCDLAFLTTQFFLFIIRCGTLCPYSYTYEAKFYEAYVYNYSGFVFSTFSLALDISVSLDRYFSFKSSSRYDKYKLKFEKRCIIIFIFSAAICAPPYLLFRRPQEFGALRIFNKENNLTSFQKLYKIFETTDKISQLVTTFIRLIRGYGLLILLLTLNVLIAFKFKRHLNQKKLMVITLKKYLNNGFLFYFL